MKHRNNNNINTFGWYRSSLKSPRRLIAQVLSASLLLLFGLLAFGCDNEAPATPSQEICQAGEDCGSGADTGGDVDDDSGDDGATGADLADSGVDQE